MRRLPGFVAQRARELLALTNRLGATIPMKVRFVPVFLVFVSALSGASGSALANSTATLVGSVTPGKITAATDDRSPTGNDAATQPPRRLSALAGNDAVAWDCANSLHQVAWRKSAVARR